MRRAVDVAVVLVTALVTVPLCVVIALVILATMGRPVLFRQTRAGRNAIPFEIFKFRTMCAPSATRYTDAQRQTAVGRILRKFSLDELPQLWNVVRGEMTLIGPRPTLPAQVDYYTDEQRRRLDVLPGLTGWAQVCGRNLLSWPQRIELDRWYIAHRSLGLDLWIVALTLWQLVCPRGIMGNGAHNPEFPMQESNKGANRWPEQADAASDPSTSSAVRESTKLGL
jgi:lipopolysaccharide/colanic/teichoic acid biosynthesis glycosyltransferase